MRKLITSFCLLMTAAGAMASIDAKFQDDGYEMRSLDLNTSANERYLSAYEAGQVLFLKGDSVFAGTINKDATGLDNVTAMPEITALGIIGTVAYNEQTKTLYFSQKEKDGTLWLYQSTNKDGKWSKPKRVNIEGLGGQRGTSTFLSNAGWNYITNTTVHIKNPSIAKGGNRIYFTSDIEGGQGGDDIWYTDFKKKTTWSAPVNAGPSINSDKDEDFAFVENDANLYFSTKRDGENSNLYQSTASGDAWNNATKMGDDYNSDASDYNLVVLDKTPYLISTRPGKGGEDIFAFVADCNIKFVSTEIKTNEGDSTYTLKAKVQFKYAPASGALVVYDSISDQQATVAMKVDSPFEFTFDALPVLDAAKEASIKAWFTDDAACVADTTYMTPAPTYKEKKRQFYWVFFLFDFDKDNLNDTFMNDIKRLAAEMRNFPDAVFEISGYTDCRGSYAYNDKLSDRRAKTIMDLLAKEGIPASSMRSVGYGERRLQIPNAKTEEEHAQNRRVEVRIVESK